MISIVVSSYKPDLFKQFENNVSNTIGTEYEIIKIDNPGRMGLCKAYNIGIEKAKYPYICFSHEDIIFHSNNWGLNLIANFEYDPQIGLIGVVGSTYKPWIPTGWTYFNNPNLKTQKRNYIHVEKNESCHVYTNSENEKASEVATLDGCCIFTKKTVANEFKFDDNLFKDYHCYDLDYALTVAQKYKVVVVYDILIEHLSQGSYNKTWLNETIKLHAKWKNLPYFTGKMSSEDIFREELGSLQALIKLTKKMNVSNTTLVLKILASPKLLSILGFKNWIRFYLYFIHIVGQKALNLVKRK